MTTVDRTGTPRSIGIVDVARAAGVSPATVSRALRGHKAVSPHTREKVQRVAAELGYAPSAYAAALARGRSNAIGVVAPWVSRWFFATVIEGVQDVVGGAGFDLLLYPIGTQSGSPEAQLNALGLHKRVEGVIGLALPYELRRAAELRNMPVVTVGTSSPGVAGVQVDDHEVGYVATRHLIELGHRRIAFFGLDPADVYGFKVADDRYDGYARALREAGLVPDPRLVMVTGFHTEAGEQAFTELLMRCDYRTEQLPTAVVAVSDEVAFGVIHAARQWGVRVPQDLSVIGVDDHDVSRLFDLTTVSQPVLDQGRIAAGMLLAQLAGEGAQTVVRLAPGLIVRGSTVPPSRRADAPGVLPRMD